MYKDSLGYYTLGIGVLVDHRKGGGITPEESSMLFQNRLKQKRAELDKALPWAKTLSDARYGVLLNMAYQLGIKGLLGFKNTLAKVQAGDYSGAAQGMEQSLWFRQTPNRARRLCKQMVTGEWQ